jgi:hypothetical protein
MDCIFQSGGSNTIYPVAQIYVLVTIINTVVSIRLELLYITVMLFYFVGNDRSLWVKVIVRPCRKYFH